MIPDIELKKIGRRCPSESHNKDFCVPLKHIGTVMELDEISSTS